MSNLTACLDMAGMLERLREGDGGCNIARTSPWSHMKSSSGTSIFALLLKTMLHPDLSFI